MLATDANPYMTIDLPRRLAAEALGSFLYDYMSRRYEAWDPQLVELVPSVARLSLEYIGNSDALYHNVEHTMLVTLAGHDIMRGRALQSPMTASEVGRKNDASEARTPTWSRAATRSR